MKKSSVLTEKDVLRTLDIPDFRHLTKEKMMEFASMLPYMDKEVAKKALEHFPNFSNAAVSMFKEYSDLAKNALQSDNINNQRVYDLIDSISKSMQELLKQPELSFENKQIIMANLLELKNDAIRLNESTKKHSMKILAIVFSILGAIIMCLACVLGVNSKGNGPTIDT